MKSMATLKVKDVGKFEIHSLKEFDELRDIMRRKFI